jgi:hypothetical protein
LVAVFIGSSILGTSFPIIQLYQLYTHNELSKRHEIDLPVIIIASVYVLAYSLYKIVMIPWEFKNAMELYFLHVDYTDTENREKGFYEEVGLLFIYNE